MDNLLFYILNNLFNSISVLSKLWEGDYEKLWAMNLNIKFQIESQPQLDLNVQPSDMKAGALTTLQYRHL